MPWSADGVYARRRWNEEPDMWSYAGPFYNQGEQLMHQALAAPYMTHEEISESVKAPLRQVAVFRPRLGFPEYTERQATISDVVATPGHATDPRVDYSGASGSFTGTSRFASNNLGLA